MNQDMKMKMEETGRDDKMNDWKDWERSRAMRKKRESDKVDNENSSKHFIMGIVWRSNTYSRTFFRFFPFFWTIASKRN